MQTIILELVLPDDATYAEIAGAVSAASAILLVRGRMDYGNRIGVPDKAPGYDPKTWGTSFVFRRGAGGVQ